MNLHVVLAYAHCLDSSSFCYIILWIRFISSGWDLQSSPFVFWLYVLLSV